MRRSLVVDDRVEVCDLIQCYLTESGYAVDQATDGAAARRLLASERYEAALLDVALSRRHTLHRCYIAGAGVGGVGVSCGKLGRGAASAARSGAEIPLAGLGWRQGSRRCCPGDVVGAARAPRLRSAAPDDERRKVREPIVARMRAEQRLDE